MTRTRRRLLGGAVAASLVLVPLSTALSYGVRCVTAVLAVVCLLRVGAAPGRRSRALFAGALLVGISGGLTATGHLLLTGEPSPAGAAADWLYLSYGPLAVAGLLALPRHPLDGPWRSKALLDALVAVSGLAFLLAGIVSTMTGHADGDPAATGSALGYLVSGAVVLAVVLAVLPRVQQELRPFLHTAGLGFALLTAGDIGYSVGVLHGWYTPTTWPAVVTQAGLVLMGMAPLRARQAVQLVAHEPAAPSLLETAAPYLPCVPALVLACRLIAQGEPFTVLQMAIVVILGSLLVLRQLLTSAEQQYTVGRLRAREREATAAAQRDPLTGLGNRTALHQGLSALLATHAGPVTLALLDLDDFKDINDTHGHDTGDAVLNEVAGRLRLAVPEDALVTRLGGDEFAVCVPAAQAPRLDQLIVEAFDQPVAIGSRRFAVTASVGVVVTGPDDREAAVVLSHVDVAMYEAKASKEPHRSGVVVLQGPTRAAAAARVHMRDEVSRPSLDQFGLVYEPMVRLADGQVVGAEALLRWQHPVLGSVGPSEFVPLAEQVGAIAALGAHALRTAAADLAGWLAEAADRGTPLTRGTIGVNVSPRQLAVPDLCDLVREVLAEHRLEPFRLVLEITEQALMDDWETAVDVVRELRSIGVGVAVDDFGTGYSSLRYLRRFDTSTVKIDREFVAAVADEPRTRALVASVVDMARSLDLSSVAEGVETAAQLEVLRELGCRFAQGYLFSRPLQRDAFGALFVGGHRYPVGDGPAAGAPLPAPRGLHPPLAPAVAVSPRRSG
jgi:diguanylate cyclase (GGDEF)-like protein